MNICPVKMTVPNLNKKLSKAFNLPQNQRTWVSGDKIPLEGKTLAQYGTWSYRISINPNSTELLWHPSTDKKCYCTERAKTRWGISKSHACCIIDQTGTVNFIIWLQNRILHHFNYGMQIGRNIYWTVDQQFDSMALSISYWVFLQWILV